MTRDSLYRALLFLIPLAYFLSQPIEAVDLGVWIALGREALAHHSLVLRNDPFSVLSTAPLVYPSWLLALAYAGLYRAGGWLAASLFHKAALLAFLAIVYRESLFRLPRPWSSRNLGIILLSWVGSLSAWSDRPNLVSLIPLALAFSILDRPGFEPRRRDFVRIGLLQVAWVNLHGSFILLPLLCAWKAMTEKPSRRGRFALLAAFCVACCLLNPFGARVFPYVLETARSSRAWIDEWGVTLPTSYFPSGACLYGLALALAAGIAWSRDFSWLRSPWVPLLALGFAGARFAALPLAVLPIFAAHQGWLVSEAPRAEEDRLAKRALNAAFVAGWAIVAVLVSPWGKPRVAGFFSPEKRPVFGSSAPFALARAIRESPVRGPVLADWDLASFLLVEQPNPLFYDALNGDFSSEELRETNRAIAGLVGWRQFMDRHGAAFAALSRARHPSLADELRRDPGWSLLYQDRESVLFVRAAR